MAKRLKKLLACVLALSLVMSSVCMTALADDPEESNGTCGKNLTWKMDSEGVLTISGEGKMNTYYNDSTNVPPWRGDALKQVVIEEGVTSIGARAFNHCPNLESISLPSTLTSIGGGDGGGVFRGCTSLKALNIPECANLKKVEIPAGASISGFVFQSCTSLESVTIPEGVATVGEGAFLKCSSLKAVKVPSTWTEIQQSTFSGCSALESVELPDTLKVISRYSVTNCKSLKDLTIPGSVKEIAYSAFSGCSSLETLTVEEGVEKIQGYAFAHATSLKNVSLPENLTFLGNNAFQNCPLGLVEIPDSVTTIEKNTFVGSTANLIGSKSLLSVIGTENISKALVIFVTGDEGTAVDSVTDCKVFVLNGGMVTENECAIPTRDSDIFAGWFEEVDFSGTKVAAEDAESGKVYYARWCTEHQWDEGVVTTPAGYGVEGEMLYTCTVCGATRTEAIPALVRPPCGARDRRDPGPRGKPGARSRGV